MSTPSTSDRQAYQSLIAALEASLETEQGRVAGLQASPDRPFPFAMSEPRLLFFFERTNPQTEHGTSIQAKLEEAEQRLSAADDARGRQEAQVAALQSNVKDLFQKDPLRTCRVEPDA